MPRYAWSDDVTLRFVRVYCENECLWNPKHEDYKKKDKREAALERMAQEMRHSVANITTKDVTTKIHSMRSSYHNELKRILMKSTDPDHIYTPALYWFSDMDSFLKNVATKRCSGQFEKISVPEFNDSFDMDANENDDVDNNDYRTDKNDSPLSEGKPAKQEFYFQEVDLNLRKKRSVSPLPNHRQIKRKKRHRSSRKSEPENTLDITPLLQSITEDEFDVYGRHIAIQLRNLSLDRALKIQSDIQNILSDARLAQYAENMKGVRK